jgi:hypothetical protein
MTSALSATTPRAGATTPRAGATTLRAGANLSRAGARLPIARCAANKRPRRGGASNRALRGHSTRAVRASPRSVRHALREARTRTARGTDIHCAQCSHEPRATPPGVDRHAATSLAARDNGTTLDAHHIVRAGIARTMRIVRRANIAPRMRDFEARPRLCTRERVHAHSRTCEPALTCPHAR